MEDLDQALLALLQANARTSVAELSRQLKVSRATVQEHINRLERRQIIQGYTLRYHPEHRQRQVCAYVMVEVDAKRNAAIVRQIQAIAEVEQLQTISGSFDLMAFVRTDSTQALDTVIDRLGELEGVDKTLSSVVLATKFQR
ncbi:MAG: Lrp/AsnC family transcriptional regulator [Granulosicoccaceae bacterium]